MWLRCSSVRLCVGLRQSTAIIFSGNFTEASEMYSNPMSQSTSASLVQKFWNDEHDDNDWIIWKWKYWDGSKIYSMREAAMFFLHLSIYFCQHLNSGLHRNKIISVCYTTRVRLELLLVILSTVISRTRQQLQKPWNWMKSFTTAFSTQAKLDSLLSREVCWNAWLISLTSFFSTSRWWHFMSD